MINRPASIRMTYSHDLNILPCLLKIKSTFELTIVLRPRLLNLWMHVSYSIIAEAFVQSTASLNYGY